VPSAFVPKMAAVIEHGMTSVRDISAVDSPKNHARRLGVGLPMLAIEQLQLHRPEERFHHCVVEH